MINRMSVLACLVFLLLVPDQAYSQRFVPMRGYSRFGTIPRVGYGRLRPSALPRVTHLPNVGAATAAPPYNNCLPSFETFGVPQELGTQSSESISLSEDERRALGCRLYYESSLGPLSPASQKLWMRYWESSAAERKDPCMAFYESSLNQQISPSQNLLERFEEEMTASRVDISVRRNPNLSATIVDLGEAGDAIVIAPLDRKDTNGVVIDTGLGKKSWKALQPFVPEEPVLLITHDHRDHTGNIGRLGDNFPALKMFPVGLTEAPTISLAPEAKASFGNEVNYSYYECSNKTFNSTFLRDNRKRHNANSNSVFTRVEHDGFSYLFTGDADKNALATAMMAYENLDFELSSNVLKWPHHAWFPRNKSAQNQLAAFLKTVDPQIVVISNIANRQSESNVSEIQEFIKHTIGSAVKVYWTTRDGTVVILSAREIQKGTARC